MYWRIQSLKEKISNSKDFFETVMLVVGCTVFICVVDFLLILLNGYIVTGKIQTDINTSVSIRNVILVFSIPSVISYIVLPTIILKKYCSEAKLRFGMKMGMSKVQIITKMITIIFLIVTIINLFVNMKAKEAMFVLVTFIFVSITEEYYIRGIVMNVLQSKYGKWLAIILSSLIFVFILHSGGNLYTNLFIRLPVSILISIAYAKSGDLYSSIFLHLGYDLLVNTV